MLHVYRQWITETEGNIGAIIESMLSSFYSFDMDDGTFIVLSKELSNLEKSICDYRKGSTNDAHREIDQSCSEDNLEFISSIVNASDSYLSLSHFSEKIRDNLLTKKKNDLRKECPRNVCSPEKEREINDEINTYKNKLNTVDTKQAPAETRLSFLLVIPHQLFKSKSVPKVFSHS